MSASPSTSGFQGHVFIHIGEFEETARSLGCAVDVVVDGAFLLRE
ncbi:hypothetical protein OG379_36260 [Streptomyces sp. NBC_01166]|nr:hypothetical protein OG379_36260 [Streptomyces sp. NBC_01166]